MNLFLMFKNCCKFFLYLWFGNPGRKSHTMVNNQSNRSYWMTAICVSTGWLLLLFVTKCGGCACALITFMFIAFRQSWPWKWLIIFYTFCCYCCYYYYVFVVVAFFIVFCFYPRQISDNHLTYFFKLNCCNSYAWTRCVLLDQSVTLKLYLV